MADMQLTPQQLEKLKQLNDYYGQQNHQIASQDIDASNTSGLSADKLKKLDEMNKYYGELNKTNSIGSSMESAVSEKGGSPIIPHPINDARDLLQGAVQGGINLASIPNKIETPIVNKLFGTKFQAPDISNIAAPIGSGNSGIQANLSRGIGEYLIPGGVASKAINEGIKPISILGKMLSEGKADVLGKMITEGGAGAASGAVNAPQGKSGTDALVNGILGAITPLGMRGLEGARPSKVLRGSLSPEDLQANLDAAAGTKTDLGSVIQNATLAKRYKNEIAPSAFSGARGDMQSVYDTIQDRAKKIVSSEIGTTNPAELEKSVNDNATESLKTALGTDDLTNFESKVNQTGDNLITSLFGSNDKDTVDQSIFNDLNNSFQKEKATKNQLYAERDKIADATPSFQLDTKNFSKMAKSLGKDLTDSIFLKNEPEFNSFMNKIKNYRKKSRNVITDISDDKPESVQPESGNYSALGSERGGLPESHSGFVFENQERGAAPAEEEKTGSLISQKIVRPTLTEASMIKNMLNQRAQQNLRSPNPQDQFIGSQFSSLAKALHDDMNDSILKSGSDELMDAHNAANKHYVEEYLPYKDKAVFKYLSGEKDSDGIAKKFIGDLTATQSIGRLKFLLGNSDLLPSSYFINSRDANGVVSHEKLASLIDSAEKKPAYTTLVDNPAARNSLNQFKNLSSTVNFAKKFLSNDGNINHDSMVKNIELLRNNPSEYQRLIPSQDGRDALNNFSDIYSKSKAYKSTLYGNGNVNIGQLSKLTENILKEPQKNYKNMSPDNVGEAVKLQKLIKMNPSSDAPMFNPPTGRAALDSIASGLGAVIGSHLGGPVGTLLGLAAPGAVVRPLSKALTSEKIRQSLVNEMLKNRNRIYTPKKVQGANTLAQGIANALQGNN